LSDRLLVAMSTYTLSNRRQQYLVTYFTEFVCKSIYYGIILRGQQNISFEREATLMSGASSTYRIENLYI
jgi:hypothetical protein